MFWGCTRYGWQRSQSVSFLFCVSVWLPHPKFLKVKQGELWSWLITGLKVAKVHLCPVERTTNADLCTALINISKIPNVGSSLWQKIRKPGLSISIQQSNCLNNLFFFFFESISKGLLYPKVELVCTLFVILHLFCKQSSGKNTPLVKVNYLLGLLLFPNLLSVSEKNYFYQNFFCVLHVTLIITWRSKGFWFVSWSPIWDKWGIVW